MKPNPLYNKGFLLCIYNSIINVITLGYIKSIKEILGKKNEKSA